MNVYKGKLFIQLPHKQLFLIDEIYFLNFNDIFNSYFEFLMQESINDRHEEPLHLHKTLKVSVIIEGATQTSSCSSRA